MLRLILLARLLANPVDVFDEAVQTKLRDDIRRTCKPIDVQTVDREWVDYMRALPAEAPGKQDYVAFLKDRYEYNIARLNAAYGIDFASFTDLTAWNFAGLDRTREAVAKDDAEFVTTMRDILKRISAEGRQACK